MVFLLIWLGCKRYEPVKDFRWNKGSTYSRECWQSLKCILRSILYKIFYSYDCSIWAMWGQHRVNCKTNYLQNLYTLFRKYRVTLQLRMSTTNNRSCFLIHQLYILLYLRLGDVLLNFGLTAMPISTPKKLYNPRFPCMYM